jgi:mannose-6-phosphate isomerase
LTIEHAIVRTKPKPWGSLDLRPWSLASTSDGPIGELWFERPGLAAPRTTLLLKMLFTTEPLSIQVHPDDAFARSIGLANGKTEAWYIVSAIPGAGVAVGLNHPRSAAELRTAITDGSIADIVDWQPVHPGDVVFIPAATHQSRFRSNLEPGPRARRRYPAQAPRPERPHRPTRLHP